MLLLSYTADVCAFCAIIQFFPSTPKCAGSYPWGYACSWLGITALRDCIPVHDANNGKLAETFLRTRVFFWIVRKLVNLRENR